MFKQRAILCLVSFINLFSISVNVCLADAAGELNRAKENVYSLIESGKYAEATSATDKLVTDFNIALGLPEAQYWIAERYERVSKFDQANSIYKQVGQKYPDSPWANKARLGFSRAEAMSFIMSQDYDRAQQALSKIVNDFNGNPDLPEALYWITERYGRIEKFKEAKRNYQQIVQNYPNSPWADKAKLGVSRSEAMSLIASGKYEQAREAVDGMAANFAGNTDLPEALFWIAERYTRVDRFEEAKLNYQQISQKYPDNPWADKAKLGALRAEAMFLIMSQDYDKAKAAIDELIANFAQNPDLPEALYWITERYERSSKFEEAKQNYQRIVQGFPNSPWANKAKMSVSRVDVTSLIVSQQYDQVQKSIDKFAADFSGDADLPEMLLTIAQHLIWWHQYEQAGNICQQIVQRYPTSLSAAKARQCISKTGQIKNIVSQLINSGNYDKVGKAVEELIAKFGDEADTPSTIYDIAYRLESAGQFALARQIYEQVIQQYIDSEQADMARMAVQRTKVLVLDESSDETSAKSIFDSTLNDFKGHSYLPTNVMRTAEGYYRMACKARENGDSSLAKKLFDKTMATTDVVRTKFPASTEVPNALYLAAECHYQLNDYQTAADLFQKVADDYPNSQMASEALYMVAETYQDLKKTGAVSESQAKAKTQSVYERLLQKYPNYHSAAIAQRWLDKNSAK
jgi:TolA-binding protein